MKVRGLAAIKPSEPLVTYEFDRRDLQAHDVALDVKFSGICHSDIHQAREEWDKGIFPMVPGHEIAGIVTSVGPSVTKFKVGDKIGVGVFVDSCRKCEPCKTGQENYCDEGMTGTYNNLERDGKTPAMGGYSNIFVIHEDYAVTIPDNLALEGVAPLLCAGITTYSPLKHWKAGPGKKVAIMGLGGLGHMGVKFAHALGAEVTVFSHSPNKEKDALAMGADHFVVTSKPGALKELYRTFDLIVNTVSAEMDLNSILETLKIEGVLAIVGLPDKPMSISPFPLITGRHSIGGSMIGGMKELQEMLNFCGEKNILSDVEIIKADYVNTAYERTVASDVKYRFVIDASTF